ncbi:amidohydrolase [Roseimicrobium sp. ORNL1]|uniref:amidohydrolase n=1 Tax=Roseimicrobium sp. ORNL1 TaxID=2711231 RepID=UPI0013E1B51D|nr:amidohydrolase [Roseimicrobium sp. ORNL1]QIF04242.1 amidohydrolase [Roseimicrobium sp. ORNL1]
MRPHLLTLASALLPLLPTALGAAPALILHGGKVITVDDKFSIHQAIAIEDGKILAVGSDAEVTALKGPDTQVLNLEGKTVMPGLMDSHVHPRAALTEFDHEMPIMESIQDVLDYIAMRAKAAPEGSGIVVSQVFITRLKEQRYPTRAELDSVAPNHPVSFATGPDAMLNSLALQMSGITKDFKITDGGPGKVELDPTTGEPTGLLREMGRFIKVKQTTKSPTPAQVYERTIELFRDYNSVGLTTVCDRGASADSIARYESMLKKGDLTVRMRCSHTFSSGGMWRTIEQSIDQVLQNPLTKGDDMLRIVGTKIWLDGGMLTGSAYMREPWGVSKIYGISDPAFKGTLNVPPDKLRQMIDKVTSAGLQFTAHSVGDGAVHELLDAYEEINTKHSIRDTRSCITHSNFMSKEDVERAAKLGVMMDIQPIWLHLDSRTLLAQFGQDRTRWFQPLKTIFETGGIVGGGSDHMQKIGSFRSVNPYNPWLGMWIAITRKARHLDAPMHPEEALTREQAIRFYTVNNAKILFLEQVTGTLEKGKAADLILVDRDPLICPIDDLPKTTVLKTWLQGKLVHEAKAN